MRIFRLIPGAPSVPKIGSTDHGAISDIDSLVVVLCPRGNSSVTYTVVTEKGEQHTFTVDMNVVTRDFLWHLVQTLPFSQLPTSTRGRNDAET